MERGAAGSEELLAPGISVWALGDGDEVEFAGEEAELFDGLARDG